MDIIEIDKTQIILVLDKADKSKYSICREGKSAPLKEGFSRLIEDFGVDESFASGVLVQIFDMKDGGCEMFVTKISDSSIFTDTDYKKYIYSFNCLDEMLLACKMLSYTDCEGSAYVDRDKSKYFLILDGEYPNICEFNCRRCKECTKEYLYEHCQLITKNAIETLSRLI